MMDRQVLADVRYAECLSVGERKEGIGYVREKSRVLSPESLMVGVDKKLGFVIERRVLICSAV